MAQAEFVGNVARTVHQTVMMMLMAQLAGIAISGVCFFVGLALLINAMS